jgi:hypothetical protein
MNMCGLPYHVKKCLEAGIDIVCAQGTEAGGIFERYHQSNFLIILIFFSSFFRLLMIHHIFYSCFLEFSLISSISILSYLSSLFLELSNFIGHTGDVSTMVLIPQCVELVKYLNYYFEL